MGEGWSGLQTGLQPPGAGGGRLTPPAGRCSHHCGTPATSPRSCCPGYSQDWREPDRTQGRPQGYKSSALEMELNSGSGSACCHVCHPSCPCCVHTHSMHNTLHMYINDPHVHVCTHPLPCTHTRGHPCPHTHMPLGLLPWALHNRGDAVEHRHIHECTSQCMCTVRSSTPRHLGPRGTTPTFPALCLETRDHHV